MRWILNPVTFSFYVVTVTTSSPTGFNETWATSTLAPGMTSTTANSKIIIDSPDDIMPIQSDSDSVRSSVIFFSASLSMFAAIGVIIFFRKCVNCPTRRHGRRRHFYPPGDVTFRSPFTTVPTVNINSVETLDATGLEMPLTPSPSNNKSLADEEQEGAEGAADYDEDNPSVHHLTNHQQPLLSHHGRAESTEGLRFYDDDIDDDDDRGGGGGSGQGHQPLDGT